MIWELHIFLEVSLRLRIGLTIIMMTQWGLSLDTNLTKWLSLKILFKEKNKKTRTKTIRIRKNKNSKESRIEENGKHVIREEKWKT